MKTRSLLTTFFLCCFMCVSYAQVAEKDESFKTMILATDKDVVFDHTIDYLRSKDFFIQSVDKSAGFIQAKIFLKDKKLLSSKSGERITVDFILRQRENETKVVLDIYSEELSTSWSKEMDVSYYKDKGIVQDESLYRSMLNGLEKVIQQ